MNSSRTMTDFTFLTAIFELLIRPSSRTYNILTVSKNPFKSLGSRFLNIEDTTLA